MDYLRLDNTGAYSPTNAVAPAAPVAIQSPQSLTTDVGALITLSGKFSGLVAGRQWYKDTEPLLNATNMTYVISFATTADSGVYFLRGTNVTGVADTAPATVTVLDVDPALPAVQSAQGLISLQNVRVTYTKPMLPDSVTYRQLQFIVVAPYDPSFKSLLQEGIIQLAILPKFPAHGSNEPLPVTFDGGFQVFTPQNAAGLP